MSKRQNGFTYCGIWPGVGRMYNVKVKNGYATIIVAPGEDVGKRILETREKFTASEFTDAAPSSAQTTDSL